MLRRPIEPALNILTESRIHSVASLRSGDASRFFCGWCDPLGQLGLRGQQACVRSPGPRRRGPHLRRYRSRRCAQHPAAASYSEGWILPPGYRHRQRSPPGRHRPSAPAARPPPSAVAPAARPPPSAVAPARPPSAAVTPAAQPPSAAGFPPPDPVVGGPPSAPARATPSTAAAPANLAASWLRRADPRRSLVRWAYSSTYSCPDSFMSSYMISSVIARSTMRSSSQAVVAGEVQRLAEPHARAHPQPRRDLARRLEFVGADHGRRDHRNLCLQREPGHAGLASVEPAVGRAGALGVDPEQLALGEHAQAGAERTLAGLPPDRSTGIWPTPRKKPG